MNKQIAYCGLVCWMQGADGGISIMDGFNLDTTVFTIEELQAIFIGLKSVDSVLKSSKATELAKKFGSDSVMSLADNMIIDLSSFYKDSLSEKIDLLRRKETVWLPYDRRLFCYRYI